MERNEARQETDIRETIERVINAGERAVEELIKVAEEEIITGKPDDDLAADRLKNAATKKLAIFDALEILQRIEQERNKLDGKDESEKVQEKIQDSKASQNQEARKS